jgi:hypothetical protein
VRLWPSRDSESLVHTEALPARGERILGKDEFDAGTRIRCDSAPIDPDREGAGSLRRSCAACFLPRPQEQQSSLIGCLPPRGVRILDFFSGAPPGQSLSGLGLIGVQVLGSQSTVRSLDMKRLVALACLVLIGSGPAVAAPGEAGFSADAAKAIASLMKLSDGAGTFQGWDALSATPGVRWAPLPPGDDESAPMGNIYFRQGSTSFGGVPVRLTARGARTMVFLVQMVSAAGPPGPPEPIAEALKARGIVARPILCRRMQSSQLWETRYELPRGAGKTPAVLHQARACAADGCREALIVYLDTDIHPMPTDRQAQFTNQCR